MELNILESIFIAVNKITQVKAYNKRLGEYSISDSILSGKIYIDIDYYNNLMEDEFVTKEIEYTIVLKDDMEVVNLDLKTLRLEVIDNQGVDCYYEVLLDTKMVDRKNDFKDISKKEAEVNEIIKEEIKENYDNLLTESLEKRTPDEETKTVDNKIEIIQTISNKDERGFLDFFDNSKTIYNIIKKIKVDNEAVLNKLSKDYGISIDDLYQRYDKENKIVTIDINEQV